MYTKPDTFDSKTVTFEFLNISCLLRSLTFNWQIRESRDSVLSWTIDRL